MSTKWRVGGRRERAADVGVVPSRGSEEGADLNTAVVPPRSNPPGARRRRKPLAAGLLALSVAALLSAGAFGLQRVAHRGAGLSAEYVGPGGHAVRVVDRDITTATVRKAAAPFGRGPFQARWTGYLQIDRPGWYSLRASADGPLAVQIDGRRLLGPDAAEGSGTNVRVRLEQGRHLLTAQYGHSGGRVTCDLSFAIDGAAAVPIPAALYSTSPPSAVRARWASFLDRVVPWLAVAWTTIALATLLCGTAFVLVRFLRRKGVERADLAAVSVPLAVAAIIFAVGINWGLPSFASWASDELSTPDVLVAVRAWFSHGWYSKYPPFHYYLVALVNAPLFVASSVGLVDPDSKATITFGLLTTRALTLVMALGTVLLVYLIGKREYGRRAGAAAAAMVAVTLQFTYYAKTSNLDVPYTFWVVLSLVFFLRVWDRGAARDSHLFALAATLAVCTKDQAYGFYLLPGAAVVLRLAWIRLREDPRRGAVRALSSALAIGLTSALLALALFAVAQNAIFNWVGFRAHMSTVSGMGHAYTGMFPNSVGGHFQMLLSAVREMGNSLGWPLFLFCAAGVGLELRAGRRARTLWLLLPALSYYLFFIGVVRYHYDRFFIAIFTVLAVFGGRAVAGLLRATDGGPRLRRRWARGLVAAAFAYSLIQCAALDQLMLLDSRYDAERWLDEHVRQYDLLAVAWPRFEYVPRLHGFRIVGIETGDDLRDTRPLFVLLNAEHATRFPVDSPQERLRADLRSGAAGYRLVYRYKARPWGNPLAYFGALSDERQDPQTNLDKINPMIEIYRKADER